MDELTENNLEEPKRKLVLNFRARIALGGILFATVLISGGFFLGYADELGGWGYFGAFFISLISSAFKILPSLRSNRSFFGGIYKVTFLFLPSNKI